MATEKSKTGATVATSTVHDYSEVPLIVDSTSLDRKAHTTTTTTAVPEENDNLTANESGVSRPDRDLKAAIWTIVCGVALPCIPIIAVSAALLAMILTKRIKIEPGWPELQLPKADDVDTSLAHRLWELRHEAGPWAYYTDRNPTTITTVASWTSRVLPYLTSSIMALVTFFAARTIATKSQKGSGDDLPTPAEVTLLINLLSGRDLSPLKDTLMHRWAYKKKLADPIPLAFTALSLITFVGLMIPIFDTWFGISTTPQTVTILSNSTGFGMQYGRSLSPSFCPHGAGDFTANSGLSWISCNLAVDEENNGDQVADPTFQLIGADNAAKILQNENMDHAIDAWMDYEDPDRALFYYITDINAGNPGWDYKAQTFAMTAQCTPITFQCFPGVQWPGVDTETTGSAYFNCSPGLQANFSFPGASQTIDAGPNDEVEGVSGADANSDSSYPLFGMSFAPDSSLSSRVGAFNPVLHNISIDAVPPLVGSNLSYEYLLPRNPLNFVAWASGFPTFDPVKNNDSTVEATNPLLNDGQIYRSRTGDTFWILNCSAAVHDFTYTYVNGSILKVEHQLASPEVAALFSAPFAVEGMRDAYQQNMVSAIKASAADDSQSLASWFAGNWAQTALALSTGVMQKVDNVFEQTRTVKGPVARVPLLPLYLLLALKTLYVIAVILLAIGAYCFTHPAETELIKEQLSAKGLAAAHFDDPGILQKNASSTLEDHLLTTPATTGLDGKAGEKVVEGEKAADQPKPGVTRTVTGLDEMTEKRVGLVARADGAWRFAVIANGMWNGIKPIAVDLIGLEAKGGNLGEAGDLINAWRK